MMFKNKKSKVKLSKQKKIDKNIGNIINQGIIFSKGFKKNKIPEKPKKILFIKFEAVGDSLLSLPSIKALKEKTNAKIYVICSKMNVLVFENQDFIDETILLNPRNFQPKRMFDLIKMLRKEKIDIVIDTGQSANISGIISNLIGNFTIGFKKLRKATRNKVYDYPVKLNFNKHMVECYFDLVEPLKVKKPKKIVLEKIKVSKEVNDNAKKLLGNKRNLVGIHACSTMHYKMWPSEKFAEIIEYLIKEKKKNIILLGSKQEKSMNEKLIKIVNEKYHKNIMNLSGKTGMRDLVEIVKHLDLFIGNDGGPMHIAASEGVKTLGLFGFETPVRYGPWGKNTRFVFKGKKCSPCIKAYNDEWPNCFNPICMQSISVNEVLDAIKKLKI